MMASLSFIFSKPKPPPSIFGVRAATPLTDPTGWSPTNIPSGAHSTYTGTCLYLLYAKPLNALRASPGSSHSTTAIVLVSGSTCEQNTTSV